MTETLCTSGAVKHRAGLYANSTLTASGAWLTELINQAEGDILAETMVDWVAGYASVITNAKPFLESACAAKAAIKVISYDTSNYVSLNEATTILNVLWGEYGRAIKVLSEPQVAKAIGGTLLK